MNTSLAGTKRSSIILNDVTFEDYSQYKKTKYLHDPCKFMDSSLVTNESSTYRHAPRCMDTSVSVTLEDGTRFYLSLEAKLDGIEHGVTYQRPYHPRGVASVDLDDTENTYDIMANDPHFQRLIQLMDDARAEARKMDQHRSEMIALQLQEEEDEYAHTNTSLQTLWVNRYSPQGYLDLLSNEAFNRTFLLWLKSWDHYVKGVPYFPPPSQHQTSSKVTSGSGKTSVPFISMSDQLESDAERMDEMEVSAASQSGRTGNSPMFPRPHFKVALLCGPPGAGKTTMAHILARHAGYEVVEVNASDERSADSFRQQIHAVCTMQGTLVGSTAAGLRPACLILDEVDGAPSNAIEVLVQAARTPLHFSKDTGANKKAGRTKTALILQRPVIVICNDLFAACLRNLRPLSLLLKFQEPDLERLVACLNRVCRKEKLLADRIVLESLIELCERDIRACLNALQFATKAASGHRRGVDSKRISLRIHDVTVGGQFSGKDMQKSALALWQEIFSLGRPKKGHGALASKTGSSLAVRSRGQHGQCGGGSALEERATSVLHGVYAVGDTEKIVQGLHENYLQLRVKDARMLSFTQGADWLCHYDLLSRAVNERQDFTLQRYQSHVPVAFHLLYATVTGVTPKQLIWPRADWECQQARTQCDQVIDSLWARSAPCLVTQANEETDASHWTRTWRFTRQDLLLDVLPNLALIAQPPGLKPLNLQLYSIQEKALLRHTVLLMLAMGLTFVQHRTPEGLFEYRMDPDIERVTQFSGLRSTPTTGIPSSGGASTLTMTYAAKQLVAREIELERMRQAETILLRRGSSKAVEEVKKQNVIAIPEDAAHKKEAPPIVPPPAPVVKNVFTTKTTYKDFFGREVDPEVVKAQNPQKHQSKKSCTENTVSYRFKEGHCNAIRRPIRMRDLFPM